MQPHKGGQRIRVDLVGSNGARESESAAVTTDHTGAFDAVFGLDDSEGTAADNPRGRLGLDPNALRPASLRARLGRVGEIARRQPVVYEVQAHIINAAELAPASSNVVTIVRRPSS